VAYASRSLSSIERNYSVTERECFPVIWATVVFRPYLYGRRFKVVTDHAALNWLKDIKSPEGRLARWGLKLQEYDMDIKNRPGKIHQNADALSRIDSSNIIRKIDMKENNWFNKVRIAQQLDPIKRIFQQFEGNKNNENINELNNFIIKNDMLYYQKPTIRMIKRGIHKIRLVIPESFKSLILEENHNSILGAHLGTKKTYQRIAENYYWEGMYKNVQEWISCVLTVL
jgi:hypothetical protein